MKKFDLEAAKNGAAVCTRDGKEARIICFDAKRGATPIIALVKEKNGAESVLHYKKDGTDFRSQFNDRGVDIYRKWDLMMKGTKHQGWINILKSQIDKAEAARIIHDTEEEAKSCGLGDDVIDTVKIEWEE